ncbi:MAG: peptidyl-prolyl cis-trans isomerase [Armatimonadetes bacterium]|nr:peptidyl-prolyl cis-trans isomerase [Armatimonadota bacterium]
MGSLFGKKEQVRCSHILVKTREEADTLAGKLGEGADFARLAREHSQCPSGKQGGDLGSFGRGQMVREFEATAFRLEPGQTSEPVKTKFGYHLIRRTG